jgi:hypothetical protein
MDVIMTIGSSWFLLSMIMRSLLAIFTMATIKMGNTLTVKKISGANLVVWSKSLSFELIY